MKELLSFWWPKVNITGEAADSFYFSLEQGVVLLDYLR